MITPASMPRRHLAATGRTALLLCAAALAACAAASTPYQPAANGFGFSEQQVETDRYRVQFRGNDVTARDTVESYGLYRAAELTVERGYDYFVVADRDVQRDTRYLGTTSGVGGFGYGGGFGGVGTTDLLPIDEYGVVLDVKMFRGQRPDDEVQAYDAREVLRNLAGTIGRPAPAG